MRPKKIDEMIKYNVNLSINVDDVFRKDVVKVVGEDNKTTQQIVCHICDKLNMAGFSACC